MLFILAFFGLQFMLPGIAFAETLNPCANPANANLDICKAAGFQFADAIGVIIQFLFVIGVILALFFLVYGGIRWITSGGDKAGVETARNTIIAAIIGLVLIFLAYIILNLVLNFLTGAGIGGITIPTLRDIGGQASNFQDGRGAQNVRSIDQCADIRSPSTCDNFTRFSCQWNINTGKCDGRGAQNSTVQATCAGDQGQQLQVPCSDTNGNIYCRSGSHTGPLVRVRQDQLSASTDDTPVCPFYSRATF